MSQRRSYPSLLIFGSQLILFFQQCYIVDYHLFLKYFHFSPLLHHSCQYFQRLSLPHLSANLLNETSLFRYLALFPSPPPSIKTSARGCLGLTQVFISKVYPLTLEWLLHTESTGYLMLLNFIKLFFFSLFIFLFLLINPDHLKHLFF